jgi:RHS repeat-associated protein
VTDQLRDVKWRADYRPFGEAILHSEDIEMSLRMPGQYYDSETGLHYNYFRDYDPGLGRYIQSDPIGLAGGLNTFNYASNNPLSYFDFFDLRNQGNGRRASGSRSVVDGNTSVFEKCQMDVTIASALATGGAVGLIVRGYGFAAAATSAASGPLFALANALCPMEPEFRVKQVKEQSEATVECED